MNASGKRIATQGVFMLRLAASSGVATAADLVVYRFGLASFPPEHRPVLLCAAAGASVGALVNFALNRVWVFRDRRSRIWAQLMRFTVAAFLSYFTLSLGLMALVRGFHVSAEWAWFPAKLTSWILVAWLFQRWFVFGAPRTGERS
jgi:putative flippase GtrA